MDLTLQTVGKEVAEVTSNGNLLCIRMKDGAEIFVAWVDDNGNVIKGKPVIQRKGFRLKAGSVLELVRAKQR